MPKKSANAHLLSKEAYLNAITKNKLFNEIEDIEKHGKIFPLFLFPCLHQINHNLLYFSVIDFIIPNYIAYYASESDWIKLAKFIFWKMIQGDDSPSNEDIKIMKAPRRYGAESYHKIHLPGNNSMIKFKDEVHFKKFDFWYCNEGTLMTKYVDFCTMIVATSGKPNKNKMKFKNGAIIKKSLFNATVVLFSD